MAATSAVVKETEILGMRAKIFKITNDGSDTSIDIVPGLEYNTPIGSYTDYTESSGTFTFTIVAGASTYGTIIFFAPRA